MLIPIEGRNTLCISSQVGCAMACEFCLTGTFKLTRNLTTAEIVNQIMAVKRDLITKPARSARRRRLQNAADIGRQR